jgi:hypothetical protein
MYIVLFVVIGTDFKCSCFVVCFPGFHSLSLFAGDQRREEVSGAARGGGGGARWPARRTLARHLSREKRAPGNDRRPARTTVTQRFLLGMSLCGVIDGFSFALYLWIDWRFFVCFVTELIVLCGLIGDFQLFL